MFGTELGGWTVSFATRHNMFASNVIVQRPNSLRETLAQMFLQVEGTQTDMFAMGRNLLDTE